MINIIFKQNIKREAACVILSLIFSESKQNSLFVRKIFRMFFEMENNPNMNLKKKQTNIYFTKM